MLKLPFTKSALLSGVKNLEHGFSNLQCDSAEMKTFATSVASVKQVHKNAIHFVSALEKGLVEADAIGTVQKNLGVGVYTADCTPLLVAALDHHNQAIGLMAIHAGWRGTVLEIAPKAVQKIVEETKPAKILISIGPTISFDSFEIGEDVLEHFPQAITQGVAKFLRMEGDRKKYLFDLPGENIRQLENLRTAVPCPMEIESIGHCTLREQERYPSYRRDKEKAGRILSFLRISS